jgi:hypothetical protein
VESNHRAAAARADRRLPSVAGRATVDRDGTAPIGVGSDQKLSVQARPSPSSSVQR